MFNNGFRTFLPFFVLGALSLCKSGLAAAPAPIFPAIVAADNSESKDLPNKNSKSSFDSTPSARGCPGTSGPYAFGSFIYWKSQLEKEDVVDKVVGQGPDHFIKIKQKEVDFKYSPGFKLGVGYNFKRDGWDALFRWTSLHSTKSHKSLSSNSSVAGLNNTLLFFPLPAVAGFTISGGEVDAHWHLHFNTLDFELGRDFFVSRYVTLRPFLGVKADWVEWKFKNEYKNFSNGVAIVAPFNTRLKQDNHGVGPRMGINSRWILSSYNFAIFGNLAGSLLYTDLKGKKILDVGASEPPGFETIGHRHELKPVIECLVGLDWSHCIRQRCNLYLSAGYEAQLWCDQTAADLYANFSFLNGEIHALQSLMFQGLTASMRLDF
jgi:hypothetical protein